MLAYLLTARNSAGNASYECYHKLWSFLLVYIFCIMGAFPLPIPWDKKEDFVPFYKHYYILKSGSAFSYNPAPTGITRCKHVFA